MPMYKSKCQKAHETIMNVFWSCYYFQQFWKYVSKKWKLWNMPTELSNQLSLIFSILIFYIHYVVICMCMCVDVHRNHFRSIWLKEFIEVKNKLNYIYKWNDNILSAAFYLMASHHHMVSYKLRIVMLVCCIKSLNSLNIMLVQISNR